MTVGLKRVSIRFPFQVNYTLSSTSRMTITSATRSHPVRPGEA